MKSHYANLRKQRLLTAHLALVVLTTLCGCVRLVEIKNRSITPMNPHNAPVTKVSKGEGKITCHMALRGTTQTFPYDPLVWHFARLPSIKSADGFPVMIDTGLVDPARSTIELAVRKGWPAYLGEPDKVAYVPCLRLGNMSVSELLVVLVTNKYQVHLLGLPLYETRGMILGMLCLAQASYLAFDNEHREVTIGFESFTPSPARKWQSYALIGDGPHAPWPRMLLRWVELPIAGKPVKLLADSGGGPRLILNPDQWKLIEPAVKVSRHRVDRYPTWGGFQSVDSYTVDDLQIGPIQLKNEVVQVRRGSLHETSPLVGLGVFKSVVAVWDFGHKQFWIGK